MEELQIYGRSVACLDVGGTKTARAEVGEVFPNRVRAKGQALGSSTHWVMNAIISGLFPVLAAQSGAYPFVFFTAMVVLQFFVVLFCYPETKGLTLEELQRRFRIS
jgi:MFS transporter, SP family, arabinose:H+ symporter